MGELLIAEFVELFGHDASVEVDYYREMIRFVWVFGMVINLWILSLLHKYINSINFLLYLC